MKHTTVAYQKKIHRCFHYNKQHPLPPNALTSCSLCWFFLSPSEDDDVFVEDLDFLFNTGTLQLSRYLKHKHITGSSSHFKKKKETLSTKVEAFQGVTAIDTILKSKL